LSNIRAQPAAYFFSFAQLIFKVTFFVLPVTVSPQRWQNKESRYQIFSGLQTFTQGGVLWNMEIILGVSPCKRVWQTAAEDKGSRILYKGGTFIPGFAVPYPK